MQTRKPDNITPIKSFSQETGTRAKVRQPPSLVKQMRNSSRNILEEGLREMFDNVDDTLFDLAEKATSNQNQSLFFDGMREVRKSRVRFEKAFIASLDNNFETYTHEKEPSKSSDTPHNKGEALQLIDEIELEESLATNNMIAKAENRMTQPLFALNERLSVVSGGAEIDNASNPVAPKAVCESFKIASEEFKLDVSVKLIIFKLFEKLVLSTLPTLYGRLNQTLKESGVLPELKPRIRRQGVQNPVQPQAMNPIHGEEFEDTQHYNSELVQENIQEQGYPAPTDALDPVYQSIANLLTSRHGPAAPQAQVNRPPQNQENPQRAYNHPVDQRSLLNAIALMQPMQPQSGVVGTQDIENLKNSLMEQIGRLGDNEAPQNLTHADEDTIDLVGMLFQFVVDDGNLPSEIKALLGRLQIPYLKAALLNKELFQSRKNPARHLLDTLANAGVGWSQESDPKGQLFSKLENTVDSLLSDFHDDLSLFDTLQDDLDEWLKKNSRRANAAERRTTEATRGKEKLTQARTQVTEEIKQIVDHLNQPLPEPILEALTRPWANVLSITYLRSGPDSKQWNQALRFARDLAWAGLPKEETDLVRLRKLEPILETALRRGLALIGYHQTDADRISYNVQSVIQAHYDEASDEIEKFDLNEFAHNQKNETEENTAVLEQHFVEDIIVSTESDEQSNTGNEDVVINESVLEQVRAVQTGTWFSFIDSDENISRSKLSWKSPISGRYLFVNQKGLKVADKSEQELVLEIQTGVSHILDDAPLMDRAMEAIANQLKDKSDELEAQEQAEE